MADELVKQEHGALMAPSAQPDLRGTEHIGKEDMKMPRLCLVQPTTKQLVDGIEGFKVGHIFNDLTGDVYGPGPIEVVIVRADPQRYMEFYPLNDGGGVKDYNVPHGDPRTLFTKDAAGRSVPPVATAFYDYVVLVLPSLEPIAISFKGTGLKAAKQLNGLIVMRRKPIFAGKYSLTTAMSQNAKGKFAVWVVRNAGEASATDLPIAEQAYEAFRGKALEITREHAEDELAGEVPGALGPDGAEDPDDFDTSKM